MPWWMMATFALCMISWGLAALVDPANFAPTITDPKALKRQRIVTGGGLLLLGSLLGVRAYHDFISSLSHVLEKGWAADLLFGCRVCTGLLFIIPAILVWFQIARRARARRRTDRPGSSLD